MVPTIQIDVPRQALAEFCRRWNVRELSLFGSVVRDDFNPASDVDVLVTFAEDASVSLADFVTMRDELAALFERRVDLVEEQGLRNPYRRQSILRDKTIIYEQS